MSDELGLGRRQFTQASLLALLSGVAVYVSGCGGSSSSPTTPTSGASDVAGDISNNHGHVAVITRAQIVGGNALRLDIQGTATHTHTVDVSAAELLAVSRGGQVARESSSGGNHVHTVTFVGSAPPSGGGGY